MIVSSFMSEYGVKIYSEDFQAMPWDEFCALLAGLSPETPLGRTVQIRLETDKEKLKYFNKHQHKIRNDWRNRKKSSVQRQDMDMVLDELKNAFIKAYL